MGEKYFVLDIVSILTLMARFEAGVESKNCDHGNFSYSLLS